MTSYEPTASGARANNVPPAVPPAAVGRDHDDLLPRELDYYFLGGARNQVRVVADCSAVLADWHRRGRVEFMAAGRPLLVEKDLGGVGIRVVDPVSRMPLAGFRPTRRGGWADLADGSRLRWLRPRPGLFERGFVGWRNANIIRFAHDGVAIVLVDPASLIDPAAEGGVDLDPTRAAVADPHRGWLPDLLALLVLGWFLILLEDSPRGGLDRRARGRVRPPAGAAGSAGAAGLPMATYPDLDRPSAGPRPDDGGSFPSPRFGAEGAREVPEDTCH